MHPAGMRIVSLYHRHRFPAEIISHCVWLYFRFSLSLRDVQELMASRGVSLTYETVRDWTLKFGQTYPNCPNDLVVSRCARKSKQTPVQREILWFLADTGEASLLGILRSLEAKFPEYSPSVLLVNVQRSLGILRRAGFLYLAWQYEAERKSMLWNESSALSLQDLIAWDEATCVWSIRKPLNIVDIIVQSTQGGVEALELIAAQSDEPTPTWRPN
jgi:hypothetical protein